MQKYVRITALFPTPLLQKGVIFVFTLYLARTTYDVDKSWFISYSGNLSGVLSSNFTIFQSTLRSPTLEQCGAITALYLVTLYI